MAASYLFLKRVAPPPSPLGDENFAKLWLTPACRDVADVKALACAGFGWGAPTRVALFLVAEGGDDTPSDELIAACVAERTNRLGEGKLLERAGVKSGSWIAALEAPPAVAANPPAAVAAAPAVDAAALLAPFVRQPLSAAQLHAFRFDPAFSVERVPC